MDYRRTKYCPELVDIKGKKKNVEALVKEEHPNAKDMHTFISDNSKKYKTKFIKVYNGKCAYCGVSIDLTKKSDFEIDHFLYKMAPTFSTKKDAGYIENLILSCKYCNRNKSSFLIKEDYYDKLYPDGEEIKNTFIRDDMYYIRINDEYIEDALIKEFYDRVQLGSELHRLDYLLMNIIGLKKQHKGNKELHDGLCEIFIILSKKRNTMY